MNAAVDVCRRCWIVLPSAHICAYMRCHYILRCCRCIRMKRRSNELFAWTGCRPRGSAWMSEGSIAGVETIERQHRYLNCCYAGAVEHVLSVRSTHNSYAPSASAEPYRGSYPTSTPWSGYLNLFRSRTLTRSRFRYRTRLHVIHVWIILPNAVLIRSLILISPIYYLLFFPSL